MPTEQVTPICPHCGYDLRASRDVCPECGNPYDVQDLLQEIRPRPMPWGRSVAMLVWPQLLVGPFVFMAHDFDAMLSFGMCFGSLIFLGMYINALFIGDWLAWSDVGRRHFHASPAIRPTVFVYCVAVLIVLQIGLAIVVATFAMCF